MKIAAIAANAAQLVIILVIFFIRGLDLGALVIFLLFLLMSVPFINFLAILFSSRPKPDSSRCDTSENGLVKREAMRIRYPEDHCPILTSGRTPFAVCDLSEGGVRIRASLSTPFKKKVRGELQLLCGDRVRFTATVVRREEGETVFKFTDSIGTAFLIGEKKAMAAVAEKPPGTI
jgi:PilZ domain